MAEAGGDSGGGGGSPAASPSAGASGGSTESVRSTGSPSSSSNGATTGNGKKPLPEGMSLPPSMRQAAEAGKDKSADRPPAEGKYRLKRGGKDVEHTLEELLALASDDHPHKLTVNGQEREFKLPDLYRLASMSDGANTKFSEAANMRKELNEKIAFAKASSENIGWFLENVLGVEDHKKWAYEIVDTEYESEKKRKAELAALAESDPDAWQARIDEDAEKRADAARERKASFEKKRSELQRQADEARAANEKYQGELHDALLSAGLPEVPMIGQLAYAIRAEYAEQEYDLSPADLAGLTAERFEKHVFGWLDGHDDERLLDRLGTERRKRLRAAELAKLNPRQKEQSAARDDAEPAAKPVKKEMTPTAFLRSGRG